MQETYFNFLSYFITMLEGFSYSVRPQWAFEKISTLMCLNIGTPKTIKFPFGTNGKLFVLGVPIFKHFRVFSGQTENGPNQIIAAYAISQVRQVIYLLMIMSKSPDLPFLSVKLPYLFAYKMEFSPHQNYLKSSLNWLFSSNVQNNKKKKN